MRLQAPTDGNRRRAGVGWAARWDGLNTVWALLLVALAFRLVYIPTRQLVEDEAVYWSWSRHLAGGYLDHPPMLVYLIRVGTALFGTNEFGVRFFCPLLAAGSMAAVLLIAGRSLTSRSAVAWVGVIWLTSPLLAGLGIVATPDTPCTFFSLVALACAAWLLPPEPESQSLSPAAPTWKGPALWMAFGASCGLAMLSKYPAVLLPASVGLALLSSRPGRRWLLTPWPYLSALPALAIFSPVIVWNSRHHWASFLFQLHHGLRQTPPGLIAGLSRYFASQLLIGTPILFVVGLIVLVHFWRRWRSLGPLDWLLLWSATTPLVFFAYASMKAQSEANWPQFAYFPLSILTVRWMIERRPEADGWDPRRVGAVRAGCLVAGVALIVLHAPEALRVGVRAADAGWDRLKPMLPLPARVERADPNFLESKVMAKLDQLEGWREMARQVAAADAGRLMVSEKYQDGAEIEFYAPGHPEVWPVGDEKHQKPFAYDYFEPRPDFASAPAVVFVGYHYRWFAAKYGLPIAHKMEIDVALRPGARRGNPSGLRSWQLVFLDRARATTAPIP